MLELVQDAVSKGAEVVGGEVHGSLMRPAIVYPVNKSMRWRTLRHSCVHVCVCIGDNYCTVCMSDFGMKNSSARWFRSPSTRTSRRSTHSFRRRRTDSRRRYSHPTQPPLALFWTSYPLRWVESTSTHSAVDLQTSCLSLGEDLQVSVRWMSTHLLPLSTYIHTCMHSHQR